MKTRISKREYIQALESKIQDRDNEIQKLKEEIFALRNENQAMAETIESYKMQIATDQSTLETIEDKHTQEMHTSNAKISQLQVQMERQSEEIERSRLKNAQQYNLSLVKIIKSECRAFGNFLTAGGVEFYDQQYPSDFITNYSIHDLLKKIPAELHKNQTFLEKFPDTDNILKFVYEKDDDAFPMSSIEAFEYVNQRLHALLSAIIVEKRKVVKSYCEQVSSITELILETHLHDTCRNELADLISHAAEGEQWQCLFSFDATAENLGKINKSLCAPIIEMFA